MSVYEPPYLDDRPSFYTFQRCCWVACLVSGPIGEPVQVLQALFELRSATDCAGLISRNNRTRIGRVVGLGILDNVPLKSCPPKQAPF